MRGGDKAEERVIIFGNNFGWSSRFCSRTGNFNLLQRTICDCARSKRNAMDRGPNPVALVDPRPLALGNVVERDRCLQLCSDIHTELMKDLLEVASATVWIQKDKFSIESMASSWNFRIIS
jgi:hypothetical protein